MANPLRGEVEVQIDGKARTVRLTNGDLCALNHRFDRGTWALLDALGDELDHRVLLATLHRGLYHGADEAPSEAELGERDFRSLEVAESLARAIWRSLTGRDPEDLVKETLENEKTAAQGVGQRRPPQTSPGEKNGRVPCEPPPS